MRSGVPAGRRRAPLRAHGQYRPRPRRFLCTRYVAGSLVADPTLVSQSSRTRLRPDDLAARHKAGSMQRAVPRGDADCGEGVPPVKGGLHCGM